jgi:phage terminase Nu1 subunit (DNA packaging protein)
VRLVHEDEPLLTRVELAESLNVGVRKVDEWKAIGLPHKRWGPKLIRFQRSEVIRWLDSNL